MVTVCDAFKHWFCNSVLGVPKKMQLQQLAAILCSVNSHFPNQTLIGGWGRWKLLPRELISIARGRGRELGKTRFAQPGSSISTSPRNATPRSRYEWQFGTSMSTPYVSGAAALVVSEFGYSGSHIRCRRNKSLIGFRQQAPV